MSIEANGLTPKSQGADATPLRASLREPLVNRPSPPGGARGKEGTQNPRPSPFRAAVPTVPSLISNIVGKSLFQGLLAAGQY